MLNNGWFKSGSSGIVFSEFGDKIQVYGYKDIENDINPIFRQTLYLESRIISPINHTIFFNCISVFDNLIIDRYGKN